MYSIYICMYANKCMAFPACVDACAGPLVLRLLCRNVLTCTYKLFRNYLLRLFCRLFGLWGCCIIFPCVVVYAFSCLRYVYTLYIPFINIHDFYIIVCGMYPEIVLLSWANTMWSMQLILVGLHIRCHSPHIEVVITTTTVLLCCVCVCVCVCVCWQMLPLHILVLLTHGPITWCRWLSGSNTAAALQASTSHTTSTVLHGDTAT